MAKKVFKIALPGYDAFTDTDPDHFALFVDQRVDYILIKQFAKDTVPVTTTVTIAHNLGYVPFCLVFAEFTPGVWRKIYGRNIDGFAPYFHVNATNLILENAGGAKNFSYWIFFDNLT